MVSIRLRSKGINYKTLIIVIVILTQSLLLFFASSACWRPYSYDDLLPRKDLPSLLNQAAQQSISKIAIVSYCDNTSKNNMYAHKQVQNNMGICF
mmetsp:Transcript_7901/g.12088  ORF Transcript_7901/g.12088 Transcript_7901/m.12088 type:complete len:95 (-) Transcript_7901:119-403(-)